MARRVGALLVALAVSASAQDSAVINEFMASNSDALSLEDGSTPDWIEIHNPGQHRNQPRRAGT